MTRTKCGLLGLCAALFGLMAFSTSAQATAGAKWLILTSGGVLKEGSTLHASLQFEKDSPTVVLHSELLKLKVLFLCSTVKTVEAKLLAEGSIGKEAGVVGGSKLLFSGCTTDINGAMSPECTPTDPVDGAGSIVTKPLHALLVLGTAGEDLIKVIPDAGKVFATLTFTETCPLAASVPLIGELFLKDCENLMLTHLVKHLIETGPGTKLFMVSETAEHTATLLGSLWMLLTGEHAGLKWSGDPA